MILGVGIDEVEVDRLTASLQKEAGLRERLFTPDEVRSCEARKHTAQHLAARFAAKEAFAKALGTGIAEGLSFKDIEIMQEPEGRPTIQLHGRARQMADARGVSAVHVSLTHTAVRAAAIVVLESSVEPGGRAS